jgi:hypothetical protein
LPQGKTIVRVLTAPKRPVKPRPMLMLAAPPPTIPALEREIAEVEERLFALRAKLSSLTALQGNGRKPKRRTVSQRRNEAVQSREAHR